MQDKMQNVQETLSSSMWMDNRAYGGVRKR